MTKDAFRSLGNAFPKTETQRSEKSGCNAWTENIVIIEKTDELETLVWYVQQVKSFIHAGDWPDEVHAWIDKLDEGLKSNTNDSTWSPSMGRIEP